jgi:hypothetical protein
MRYAHDTGDTARADRLNDRFDGQLKPRAIANNRLRRQLTALNRQRRELERDRTLSARQKADKMREIGLRIEEVSKRVGPEGY